MAPRRTLKPDAAEGEQRLQTIDRVGLYRKLSRLTGLDALHQLIAAHGPEILDKGLPYLLVAARNWKRSALRRRAAHVEVSVPDLDHLPSSLWDPFRQLEQKESLRAVLGALAELDDQDVLVVWRHAEGHSDEEIRREWNALGFEPRDPSVEYLRKRRQRARESLRETLRGR